MKSTWSLLHGVFKLQFIFLFSHSAIVGLTLGFTLNVHLIRSCIPVSLSFVLVYQAIWGAWVVNILLIISKLWMINIILAVNILCLWWIIMIIMRIICDLIWKVVVFTLHDIALTGIQRTDVLQVLEVRCCVHIWRCFSRTKDRHVGMSMVGWGSTGSCRTLDIVVIHQFLIICSIINLCMFIIEIHILILLINHWFFILIAWMSSIIAFVDNYVLVSLWPISSLQALN